jgi:hypothetical protein
MGRGCCDREVDRDRIDDDRERAGGGRVVYIVAAVSRRDRSAPAGRDVVVRVADPFAIVTVPIAVAPLKKVTVPVGAMPLRVGTASLSVIDWPMVGEVFDAVRLSTPDNFAMVSVKALDVDGL